MTALIISNEEIEIITKIAKSLHISGLLIQSIIEKNKSEAQEQNLDFPECYLVYYLLVC